MSTNSTHFLEKVLGIIKDERSEDAPLIRFVYPKELEVLLIYIFIL